MPRIDEPPSDGPEPARDAAQRPPLASMAQDGEPWKADAASQERPISDEHPSVAEAPRRRVGLPLALFLFTIVTTFLVGGLRRFQVLDGFLVYDLRLWDGLIFSGAVMLILTLHEFGHFFQAVRYGVPASLPYFIPVPPFLSPFGTMGAVILMPRQMGDRRALFDIGISGPLAGLVPAIVCCAVGIRLSTSGEEAAYSMHLYDGTGSPLLFTWLFNWLHGPLKPNEVVGLHPLAFAGWAGLFFTALNMLPIGQLDGGHVLYSLLLKRADALARFFLMACAAVVMIGGLFDERLWMWWLMLLLLFLMGPRHPPTARDNIALGPTRTILGWLSLTLFFIGFTPVPFFI